MVQYSVPPMVLNTNTVHNAQPTTTQQEAPTRRSAARKRQSASEKAAATQHNAYQPSVPQQHAQRSPIASADLQNAHCKVNASGAAFDSPSPSQVVPQMNADGYDPLSVGSTPSSCSYLPPISTLAPSSAGSSTQQLSPPLNDSTLTSTQHNYSTHTSDLQQQYAHQHPSTSAHGFMTDSLGEDLNCIDYNQLLSNAGTITTEEYLPSQQQLTATYVHPGAHDGSQHYSHHGAVQHGGVYGQPPMVHQNVQRVRQTFNQEATYQQQQVMQPKTSVCYTTYPHPNHTWPAQAYGNHGMMPSHHQMSSSTPDSGIQSIDGSPPSVSSYTPPMVSPYMTHAASNGECRAPSTPATTCNEVSSTTPEDDDNDFSDMPTLLPEGCIPQEESVEQCTTEAPNLVVSSTSKSTRCASRAKNDRRERSRSSASRPSTATGNRSLPFDAQSPDAPSSSTFDIGSPNAVLPASCSSDMSIPSVGTPSSAASVIAITPTMDPKEIWKTLEGTLCAEKLKEIKSLIEAKAAASENAMTGTAAASVVKADRCASGDTSEPTVANSARTDEPPPTPIAKRPSKVEESQVNANDERQRVLEYRRHVKAKLRERMQVVINELEDRFKGIRLDLGRCIKLPLPWQPINWKAVDERMASRAAERRKQVKKTRRQQPQVDERRKRKSAENASPDGRRSKRGKKEKEQPEEQRTKSQRSHANALSPPMDVYQASPSPSTSSSLKITLIRRPSQDGEEVLSKRLRTNAQSDGYTPITKNIFVDPPQAIPAPPACTCDALNPCTENSLCARRQRNAECTEKSCTVGAHDCRNRRISKNRVLPVDALKTFATSRGDRGVCSKLDLRRGQYICEYVGEVVRLKNYKRRSASREPHHPRYGMHLLPKFVVDATQKGNIARFLNHSCQPNCEMQKWLVNGQYRLAIFASEDIPAGQELTYDYSAFHVSLEPRQKCECGEVGCLGTIPA
ncbi:SET domain containing protein, partial [Aphelenchoides avenae]